jgi:integrase
MAEQRTLNPQVLGSNPRGRTTEDQVRGTLSLAGAACGPAFDPGGFVLTHTADRSRPVHPDNVTSGFRRVCVRLGIEGVRLHDLRHLHATQLLAAGAAVRPTGSEHDLRPPRRTP